MISKNGNITFGYTDWRGGSGTDDTEPIQYFELNSTQAPYFNFSTFAAAVKDNATECGFHFRIATS